MANSNTQGYGLIPVGTLGNTPSTQGQSAYKIDAGYSAAVICIDKVLTLSLCGRRGT